MLLTPLKATDEPKTTEELIAMGGKFYEVDGVSWCETSLDTWKLVNGASYATQPMQ